MSDKPEHWRREKKKYRLPSLLLLRRPVRPTGRVEIALLVPASRFCRKLLKRQIKVFRSL